MIAAAQPITVDDLAKSEVLVRRAVGRVETHKKRLAHQEALLLDERDRHAKLVEAYGKQHCPGTASQ